VGLPRVVDDGVTYSTDSRTSNVMVTWYAPDSLAATPDDAQVGGRGGRQALHDEPVEYEDRGWRPRRGSADEDHVVNVLQYHQQTLVKLIHSQMHAHFVEEAAGYEAHVTKGFRTLRANNYTAGALEKVRDFRTPIPDGEKSWIRTMLFGGFARCLYPEQKFDTDSERRFAVILENDDEVLKWFKPAKGDFQIHYSQESSYEPDFVVETKTEKLLCEPKRASEMTDDVVLSKTEAAAVWCHHASQHAKEGDGKAWKYLLIPHDAITDQMTLSGLAARCEVHAESP